MNLEARELHEAAVQLHLKHDGTPASAATKRWPGAPTNEQDARENEHA
jgi:hypothetical protein